MEHRWDFFPVATFYWLAHFAILTKLQCCCMTMAWYWWCSTNQNRSSELVILIALGHIDSIPAAGWLKRFDEAFPLKVVVVRLWGTQTIKGINLLRETGGDNKYQSQIFATRWEAESMTRCIMFVNVYNLKEATQRLLLQIWAARFQNLQINKIVHAFAWPALSMCESELYSVLNPEAEALFHETMTALYPSFS